MYIIFLCAGAFLIVLGLIVWVFKVVDIIAGYDPEKVTDKDGLARWVGRNLIIMGAVIIIIAIVGIIVPGIGLTVILPAYLIIVLGICIATVIGTRKYEKR
jgi:hypothetical protein